MDTMLGQTFYEFSLEYTITEFGQPILRYCHAILCNYHDAQDAVQLVFIKANKNAHKLKPDTNISAWLYKIAYTTCVDMLRAQKRRKTFEESLPTTYQKNTGMSPQLELALAKLSPKDRALVFSRAVDEMEYSELAKIHGVKEPAIRKRYERAKNKLAKYLTEVDENE